MKKSLIKSPFEIIGTSIDFTDTAVAITDGGRFIAQLFVFPDGTEGTMVIIRKGEEEWQPDITNVTINYENNTSTE